MGKRPLMIGLGVVGLLLSGSLLIKVLLTPSIRRKRRQQSVLRAKPLRKPSPHRSDLDLIDYYDQRPSPLDKREKVYWNNDRRQNDARIRIRTGAGRLTDSSAPRPGQRGPVRTKADAVRQPRPQGQSSCRPAPPRPPAGSSGGSSARRPAAAPRTNNGSSRNRPSGQERGQVRQFPTDPRKKR